MDKPLNAAEDVWVRITPRTLLALLLFSSAIACSSRASLVPNTDGFAPSLSYLTSTPPPHATIPLYHNKREKAGLSLRLSVGGAAVKPYLLDTGSAGLWAYFNAFGPAKNYMNTHVSVSNTYSSGIIYDGTVVYTSVGFEGRLVAKSVPVVLVTSASCTKKIKNCPAAVTQKHCASVYKNPPKTGAAILCLEAGRGLFGTFGADLEPTVVPTPATGANSPSTQPVLYNVLFGIASWSSTFVITPNELQLGPNPPALRGFEFIKMRPTAEPTMLPNGALGWKRDVNLCFAIGSYVKRYCVDTLFDTGATNIHFQTSAPFAIPTSSPNCGFVVRGQALTLSRPNRALMASLKTGYKPDWNAMLLETPKPGKTPEVNTGLTFYNRDEILFDARTGRVGLKSLQTPGHLGQKGCNGNG